jgi:hypothetical protein
VLLSQMSRTAAARGGEPPTIMQIINANAASSVRSCCLMSFAAHSRREEGTPRVEKMQNTSYNVSWRIII